ncbi:MAG: hypothetical protein ACRDIY_16945, partial [Chloroflexota bacterium]
MRVLWPLTQVAPSPSISKVVAAGVGAGWSQAAGSRATGVAIGGFQQFRADLTELPPGQVRADEISG